MSDITLSPAARRQFDRLPKTIKVRVLHLVERLEHWPRVSGMKPLTGNLAGHFRLRTGDYRLQFRIAGDQIIIERIGHRADFYDQD